ncbi:batten's disease protein Cln3 [Ascobolus immersus RN42]|uniref:Protein BTN n=1 Tax=Ascobolus immersus RN42 TaxID=1160509 RepID=A0A3N4HDQ4_ASCIM|nr:batten's disease protein Cln3 [Ascobolus immersus RN42]
MAGLYSRLSRALTGASPPVCLAFFLFGLINNILYVILLTAALDLVGPDLPKSMVLLFDVLPSFLTKLLLPHFVQSIPYAIRIPILVLLAFVGMQCVGYSDSISGRMAGVVLASISSGGGELSFLGLTHYYPQGGFAIAFWGSGTGAAGLAGAGLYQFVTTGLGWDVVKAVKWSSLLPLIMLVGYFVVLPKPEGVGYERVDVEDGFGEEEIVTREERGLLAGGMPDGGATVAPLERSAKDGLSWGEKFRASMRKTKPLFFPYMLPLLLVYIAEYTVNQGVSPTLLFPIEEMPFQNYRDAYVSYNTVYQLGVFISRSSTPFIRIHHLYLPSLLQCFNLFLLILQALYMWLPNIYWNWMVVFWEGLLGGAVYVNTFAEIADKVPLDEREFSLSAVTVSDSGGIAIAGFIGLWLEGALCRYQVRDGREWCTLT